uniref:Uncharacterized protein n=1 Tax=Pygocentrus nattereri TaxID=42514 RepID=A0A3B4E1N5_PYGNA
YALLFLSCELHCTHTNTSFWLFLSVIFLDVTFCRPSLSFCRLNKCSITEEGCAALSSALCSNPSHLIELDLSENQLGTSGRPTSVEDFINLL